jgi:hypothetical protein
MSDFNALTSAYLAGAAAGALTVTGIKLGDRLVLVQDMTNGKYNAVSEYTITADDTIDNTGGTSTSGHSVLIVWERAGGGRSKFETDSHVQLGRTPY